MSALGERRTIRDLHKLREDGIPIAMLTCYDASFAALLDEAALDVLLVGDSLGMVIQGAQTTLEVTLEQMEYHTRCVARGSRRAFLIADMPFGSYEESRESAFRNAARLLAAGAQMVKLEGGAHVLETVRFLVERGVPVCGHLGLTPQAVHQFGGFRVQGRDASAAEELLKNARSLQLSGASLLVLEAIPAALAEQVTKTLAIPTIGIGAGPACSGQVLVLYDILDLYPGKKAKFVQNFMSGSASLLDCARAFVAAVKERRFPAREHSFQ